MKQKNFNRTTLNLYDKQFIERLEQDFWASGMHNKSEYLTSLIKLGLQTKSISNEIVNLSEQINGMQNKLDKLYQYVLRTQTENETYKTLLCNMYYIIESYCLYNELPSYEQIELGLYDHLPDRLYERLKKLREVFGAA